MAAGITVRDYGRLPDGRAVHEYRLDNGRGLVLTALDWGGIVTGLWLPDLADSVVLGLRDLDAYLSGAGSHLGVIAGRYANRIAKGSFELDGERFTLTPNDGANCLHGGPAGFGASLWQGQPQPVAADGSVSLLLERLSPNGEMGFPGTMHVAVRYTLGADMSWRVDYEATTDRPTVVNLTSHAYFNLGGAESGSALEHRLTLPASRYTVPDSTGIPLGHASVDGTPFDFRRERVVGRDVGYDHNWLLDGPLNGELRPAAQLRDPASGRSMAMWTTEPAIQFYAGTWMDGSLTSPGGRHYLRGAGLCLETQHSPDSPNRPVGDDWPSTVLRPGEVFRSSTLHRFGG
ncbi:aldose epimerase family protein [Roseateles asaccharophilus]|uniref:Aldose 1-epimerase n=1 Tax=Roseateles asaccharophilus TaxID=582607 RepID=A0ABU2A3P9_9BURK|nr:aldose epimerase family protein [Roseateles asaccharophilus]MDR7331258.1 aldose 1-epimerase [Roseateles asaccharophilus]